jgi:hypothetical protein
MPFASQCARCKNRVGLRVRLYALLFCVSVENRLRAHLDAFVSNRILETAISVFSEVKTCPDFGNGHYRWSLRVEKHTLCARLCHLEMKRRHISFMCPPFP